jgi:RHS repeat-associated protein
MSRGTATTPLEKIDYTYDPTSGKKASETVSAWVNGAWATKKSETYTYTSDGNLSSTVHADNTRQLFAYLPDGTLSSVQDENHTTPNTTYGYDPAGRLSTVAQTLAGAPGGQIVTRYGYDIQGNLTSVTDPNGNVTTYVYDDFRRMQRQISPVSGVTTYAYDAAGNLLTTTDANGAVTTRTYDALGRVLSSSSTRSSATETVSWTYDDATPGNFGIGRLATMTDPTGSTTYAYDRRGLLRSEAKVIAGSPYRTSYAYDANGNRSTMNYPNGIAAHYTFDFADRPYSLANGSTTIVASAGYLPFGPLTTLAFGNGTTRSMSYDTRYRPTENKLTGPGGTIADYIYAEDNNGNITQIHDATDARYNRDFGYDDLNRLTTANSGSLLWGPGSYSYDAMGNMLSSTLGTWKTTSSSLVGTTPKLESVVENGASRAVTYDAAGNETAVGGSAFSYSARNALASADTSSYVYDGRGILTMATISVLSISVAGSSVTGGGTVTATVTLAAPAAADTTISLSSNDPAATVPPIVTIPLGALTASFTVATAPVAAVSSVTITAAFAQYAAGAVFNILPPDLQSLTISPSSVSAGNPATGTATLNGAAAVATVVSLSSDDTGVSVSASVTVAAGSTSAPFSITTTPQAANRTATVTASLNGTTRQASLVLLDARLTSLSVTPSSVLNGGTATGTVTLDRAAAANITISLMTSSYPDAYFDSFLLTVPAGASSANFTIRTNLQTVTGKTMTISATQGAIRREATLTVNPPWLSNLAISPATMVGGDPAQASTTLNAPAPGGSYSVMFTSSNTALVATPHSISYGVGATSGQTTVLTNPVLTSTSVLVTATDPTGISRSQTVTLQPAPITLASLTLSATSVVGMNSLTGTVTLTAVAPAGGIDVDLTGCSLGSPNPYVRVPSGSQSASFQIRTGSVIADTPCTISAIHAATTKTATFTLKPPTATNFVGYMIFTPSNEYQLALTGGSTATLTVSLGSGNATKNTTITLTSSNTAAAVVPGTITIVKGTQTQSFTVTTSSVTTPADVTLTAAAGGTTTWATLIVLPAGGAAVASVSVIPSRVSSGALVSGTVNLTGPAPAGGLTVTLGGSRTNIVAVSAQSFGSGITTLVIPAGASSGTVYVQSFPFTGIDRGTLITAASPGVVRSTGFLMTAQPQASLKHSEPIQCAALALSPCLSAAAAAPHLSPLAVGDATGYYLYTTELRLLAETEVSAAAAKQIAFSYLWFGDLPVASIETSSDTTRWYATDHLGTPYVMTDASGAAVWRAEYAPYGTVFGARTGAMIHQPLRFPGQIAMDGTDTYYNVYRHYRSGWGRYTSPDPIGLSAGTNLFAYAYGIPTGVADPRGLYAINKSRIREVPMTNIRAACAGLGSACTLGSGATLECHCDCNGKLSVDLLIFGTLYYFPGNPKALGASRPFDTSVVDAASSIAHEWAWHLDLGIRRVDPIIRELESKSPFGSKEACERTCGDYAVWVNDQFASVVSATQTLERNKHDPRKEF